MIALKKKFKTLYAIFQVDLLKNKLGFDEAFNYNDEPNLDAALKRLVTRSILNYKHFPLGSFVLKSFCDQLIHCISPVNRCFPQGIDIYFDNVGGEMLDAALLNMKDHGRIAVCGMVSLHSYYDPKGIHNLFTLVTKRITMKGFLQSDYLHLYPRFLDLVISNYKQGKIVYIEDMNEGLESAPSAFVGLFSGKNIGKQVVRVACE